LFNCLKNIRGGFRPPATATDYGFALHDEVWRTGANAGVCSMFAVKSKERRRARRRLINRVAKIQVGSGSLPRDCLITNISTGGVRLHVEGVEVPDDFVLVLSGDDLAKECKYRVVWRLGHEIGAQFVGLVRRGGDARA
jgi:hypothetical protein